MRRLRCVTILLYTPFRNDGGHPVLRTVTSARDVMHLTLQNARFLSTLGKHQRIRALDRSRRCSAFEPESRSLDAGSAILQCLAHILDMPSDYEPYMIHTPTVTLSEESIPAHCGSEMTNKTSSA